MLMPTAVDGTCPRLALVKSDFKYDRRDCRLALESLDRLDDRDLRHAKKHRVDGQREAFNASRVSCAATTRMGHHGS